MGRIAGRRGRMYIDQTANGGGSASALPFMSDWNLDFSTEKIDVTSMDDEGMVSVSGLPKQEGKLSAWYDDASNQTYLAATDGAARKFYLYPNRDTATQYWFGTATFDFSVSAETNGAVKVESGFSGATKWAKVG